MTKGSTHFIRGRETRQILAAIFKRKSNGLKAGDFNKVQMILVPLIFFETQLFDTRFLTKSWELLEKNVCYNKGQHSKRQLKKLFTLANLNCQLN